MILTWQNTRILHMSWFRLARVDWPLRLVPSERYVFSLSDHPFRKCKRHENALHISLLDLRNDWSYRSKIMAFTVLHRNKHIKRMVKFSIRPMTNTSQNSLRLWNGRSIVGQIAPSHTRNELLYYNLWLIERMAVKLCELWRERNGYVSLFKMAFDLQSL